MTTYYPAPTGAGFLTEVSLIEQSIQEIQKNIHQIQNVQSQLISSTSFYQTQSYNEDRDSLLESTKTLLFDVKDRIKKIEYENSRLSRNDPNLTVRRQRHAYLKEKFTNMLDDYRNVEDMYMKQHKERLARQYRVVNPEAMQSDIDAYLENPSNQPVFAQALVRSGEARAALLEVQQRHEDIKQIEQTIAELAQLFQEMQLQVEAQDNVLVSVQEDVEDTLVKVESANQQLDYAEQSAIAARKKKWLFLAICAVVVLIIMVVVIIKLGGVFSTSSNSSNSGGSTTVIEYVPTTTAAAPTRSTKP